MPYTPPKKILEKYADVMVNFALGFGKGIKKGDVVMVWSPEVAKPLYHEILKAIWKAGGHVIGRYTPDSERRFPTNKDFYNIANIDQLKFFPAKLMKAQINTIDHQLGVDADVDPHSLKGIDAKKIMTAQKAKKPYHDWWQIKENSGKLTWTICLYGTEGQAKEAGLSIKQYWSEIIKACFLDKKDPIKEWKKILRENEINRKKLSDLRIEKVHIRGPDADLWIKIGKDRIWQISRGHNIPSYEIYTSPDWRGTNGWIRFNKPLYRYGNLITGIELWFKNGRVIRSKAKKNEKVLKAMIATKNADKIGEYSLTDGRFSRIRKFMAETLFDENVGGPHGNTHLAFGASYHDCYRGQIKKVFKSKFIKLGFNDSVVHTDIMSTSPRTVTAYLPSGKTKVIYKNGQFTL